MFTRRRAANSRKKVFILKTVEKLDSDPIFIPIFSQPLLIPSNILYTYFRSFRYLLARIKTWKHVFRELSIFMYIYIFIPALQYNATKVEVVVYYIDQVYTLKILLSYSKPCSEPTNQTWSLTKLILLSSLKLKLIILSYFLNFNFC